MDVESYRECQRGLHSNHRRDAFKVYYIDEDVCINVSGVQRGEFVQSSMVLDDAIHLGKVRLGADGFVGGQNQFGFQPEEGRLCKAAEHIPDAYWGQLWTAEGA